MPESVVSGESLRHSAISDLTFKLNLRHLIPGSNAMRLIINADDLGYNGIVNDSIFRLMSEGMVTSASLIMNAPAAEDAAHRANDYTNCSFGVHLNITEFAPLSSALHLSPILSNGGSFNGKISRTKITTRLLLAIFTEWSEQIERAKAVGLRISHIDLHHHVHTIPQLFVVVKLI